MTRAACRVVGLAGLLLVGAPSLARAQIDQFERCRARYDALDYEAAVACFEALVGGETPRLDSPALVAESRKYLGAAYLFVGRRDAAREQFELLLREQPLYVLDPRAFPVDVQELFDAVRDRLLEERRQELARQALEERALRAEARARALLEFAEEEVSFELEGSRWLALLPLGVGQFQNGNDGLGWFFVTSEVALLGVSIGAMIWHQLVQQQIAEGLAVGSRIRVEEGNRYSEILFAVNWASLGALAAVAIGGIIEAQASFVPIRTVTRRREVPEELREDTAPEPREGRPITDLRVGVGLGSLTLSLRF